MNGFSPESASRVAEKEAKNKLLEFLNTSVTMEVASPNNNMQRGTVAAMNGFSPESAYPVNNNSPQVVPDMSPDLAALNLNMEDLSQSAFDLTSGLPMAAPNHFSVPNLSLTNPPGSHRLDLSSSRSHDMMSRSGLAHDLMTESDMEALSLEIERERFEYLEKSKHLQDQLHTFKSEIEELKVDDKITVLDKIHCEQQQQGDTKYSTIQKVKRGSTQSRVAFFEEL